jgi:hypothetical protein
VPGQVSTASTLPTGCGLAIGDPLASPIEAYAPNSSVQPQLAADPAAPARLYGVWEQDRWNAIGTRAINLAASADGGATWGAIAALPFSQCGLTAPGSVYDRASDPSIAVGSGGVVFASALAFSAGGFLAAGGTSAVLVTRSTDGGKTWQSAPPLIADAGTGAAPYYFNDRDAIAADPNSPHAYVVWDRISNDITVSMPTWLAISADNGLTWPSTRVIYDPNVADPGKVPDSGSQTLNNQLLVLPNGHLVDIFTLLNGFIIFPRLTAIRSTDFGATWSPNPGVLVATIGGTTGVGSIPTANPIALGAPIRDSSNMAQTAVDSVNGTLAVVWQDSRFSSGARNGIALSLSSDEGATWSAPVQVNQATGVAAFNPSVHFGAGGKIAVTYYDLRAYVSSSTILSTDLWLCESNDGGVTWAEKRLFGPFDLNQAPPADQGAGSTGNALFLGDQQGLAWNGTQWAALFSATNAQGAYVFAGLAP